MTPVEVVSEYLTAFASGDPDAVAAFVTDDFVNEHTAALGSGCSGRDAYRQRLPGFLADFAGVRYGIDDVVAEGDRAVVAYTMRAEFRGTPITVRGVMRFRLRGERIAHRVDYWDSLQFLLQVDPDIRDALAYWL